MCGSGFQGAYNAYLSAKSKLENLDPDCGDDISDAAFDVVVETLAALLAEPATTLPDLEKKMLAIEAYGDWPRHGPMLLGDVREMVAG